jgi:Ca2+-binding RTX toxin-like protein
VGLMGAMLAIASAAPALAGTVTNRLSYDAAPGEVNTVRVTVAPGGLVFPSGAVTRVLVLDSTAPVVAGAGCTSVDAHTAQCVSDTVGMSSVEMTLGDRDDSVSLDAPLSRSTLYGGEGDDLLTGLESAPSIGGSDVMQGGPGDDHLVGRGGDDRLDYFHSWEDSTGVQSGRDTYEGGAGTDSLSYERRTGDLSVTLDEVANDGEAGEGDNVGADVENVTGGEGNDTLIGNAGSQTLRGNGGTDLVRGAAGADVLYDGVGPDRLEAGAGNDTIHVQADAAADVVYGGAGTDSVDYNKRAADALAVSLNDAADDGTNGEGDNVHSDVENVLGGGAPGSNTFDGGAAANVLSAEVPQFFDGFPVTGPTDDAFYGGAGNDTLLGYTGSDRLFGGAGADTISAWGGGADVLSGGAGNDFIDARNAERDGISCGPGVDRVYLDPGEPKPADCEVASRERLLPGPTDSIL